MVDVGGAASSLGGSDLRLAPGVIAHSSDEAVALARVFGFPVAAKIASAKAIHKTDSAACAFICRTIRLSARRMRN